MRMHARPALLLTYSTVAVHSVASTSTTYRLHVYTLHLQTYSTGRVSFYIVYNHLSFLRRTGAPVRITSKLQDSAHDAHMHRPWRMGTTRPIMYYLIT